MIFSSVLFVFMFFPVTFALYYLSKENYRNVILLVASLIFYSYGGVTAFCLMLFSITVNYLFARLAESSSGRKKKAIFIMDVIINLGILAYFKYMNFGIHMIDRFFNIHMDMLDIALPVGISFFTFQAMSYVIDVYRGEVKAERNLLNVGLYISFFPQLVAGPIVRYKTIANQIKIRETNIIKINEGSKRFIIGFGKKVIFANNLAIVAEEFFQSDVSSMPILSAWIGSIAFSLQIYYDFSGYSDMAIGLGKVFGFTFEENFNYPYISRSITEFWRRWHISLSQWFRDYVYIPLGGSRSGKGRQILHLSVVWFLTGLWHGASFSFIVWGLMYLMFLIFEKFLLKPEKRNAFIQIVWCFTTLLVVNFGWVLFNARSLHTAARYIAAMLGYFTHTILNTETMRVLHEYGIYLISGAIFATPLCPIVINKFKEFLKNGLIINGIIDMAYLFIFLWAVSFLILGAHNPFIYFNF